MKAITSIFKAVMFASYDFHEDYSTDFNEDSAKRFCR